MQNKDGAGFSNLRDRIRSSHIDRLAFHGTSKLGTP